MHIEFNLATLDEFLVRAKKHGYAGHAPERVNPDGSRTIHYSEVFWKYEDNYAGHYNVPPGVEKVWFKDRLVWSMAYSGGMLPEYFGDHEFAEQTFGFLKEALGLVTEKAPFRGPEEYSREPFEYAFDLSGDIRRFRAVELIVFNDASSSQKKLVYTQDVMGGLVIARDFKPIQE